LSKLSTAPAVDPIEYREIVGALCCLVNTRQDLAYVMGYYSRFMERPTTEHLLVVKRLLRYVAGTTQVDCFYKTRKEKKLTLVGYSDNDLAGDINTYKSTTGFFFLVTT
jgi:hypothetical protein